MEQEGWDPIYLELNGLQEAELDDSAATLLLSFPEPTPPMQLEVKPSLSLDWSTPTSQP